MKHTRRRNPAWLAPLLAAVVPLVIAGIGKVLGYGVSTFNALPREERRAKLRQVLGSRTLYMSMSPVLVASARREASSPAAVEAIIDAIEKHGAGAVSAGTGAAQALASRKLAERTGATKTGATEAGVKTNGRRRNSSLVGTINDRLGLTPYLRGDGTRDAYDYIVSGKIPAGDAGRAQLARVVEKASTSTYADTRAAGHELARALGLPRKNHYHVGPAVAMVNRRRNGAPWPPGTRVRLTEGYVVEAMSRWSSASRDAVYRATAEIVGKNVPEEYEDRWGEMPWRVRWIDGPLAGKIVEYPAWAIMLDARKNGRGGRRRKNSLVHVAAGFAAGAVAEKKLGVVGRATGLLKNPARYYVEWYAQPRGSAGGERRRTALFPTQHAALNAYLAEKEKNERAGYPYNFSGVHVILEPAARRNPANPARRDEYLSLVASAARAVVRERQRSVGTTYQGDNERSLETALGMAQGVGYGPEARALARAILREAPSARLAPGVAWTRKKARAHRAATGDRNWPVRNPAQDRGKVVFSKDATYDGRKRFEARVEGAPWDAPKITIEQAYGVSKHGATKGQRLGPADAWEASVRGFTGRGGSTTRVLGRGSRAAMKKLATDLLIHEVP